MSTSVRRMNSDECIDLNRNLTRKTVQRDLHTKVQNLPETTSSHSTAYHRDKTASMAQNFNKIFVYGSSVALIAVILYGVRKYRSKSWGRCTNKESLVGKTVLITGANSGLGYETAKELSLRGADIIMACRNKDLAQKAITKIENSNISNKLLFIEVDLGCLDSVVKFSSTVAQKYSKIDILVNNAGVSIPNKQKMTTPDGLEIHFGVNYLSHFLLTTLMMPLLEKAGHARVINVSSQLHQRGSVNLEDINYEKHPPKRAYADSKLQQIYFGQELANKTMNKSIQVYNLCPGWVYTNLFRHSIRNVFKLMFAIPVAFFFMRSAKQGAQTIIYCATEPALKEESGKLYRDCHRSTSTYEFTPTEREQLWTVSKDLIESKGIKVPEI
ncbi:retinol dehydrogenase 11-like [Atheta coriaria]|uniref:retinol dehydrogenase 11-like n=1 Tax=Dalotia coriaria TaxID=877792 RepID=UPI0031F45F7D